MSLIQIVNIITLLSLVPLIATCYAFAQLFIQRFPAQQRMALEQFARQAVRYVEYQHREARGDRKELAIAFAADMFRLSGLPEPHKDILEVAVGAALYELEQHNG